MAIHALSTAVEAEVLLQSRRAGLNAGLDWRLVSFLDGATESLDCAVYDLRSDAVLGALRRAVDRGVAVRLLYDAGPASHGGHADPRPGGSGAAIAAAGLDRVAVAHLEQRGHLMHNKFAVRDRRSVWTGSANWTEGGLLLQDNNCLVLESAELAAAYTADLEVLLADAAGGRRRPAGAVTGVRLGDAVASAAFEPDAGEGIESIVVAALRGATRVRMLAFVCSDPGILAALAELDAAGADLGGVYDSNGMAGAAGSPSVESSLYWFLDDRRFARAPSHPYHPGGDQDFMHNKVLVIDGSTVITGSYNFSEHAEANDENLLVIESERVAAAYEGYCRALTRAYSD